MQSAIKHSRMLSVSESKTVHKRFGRNLWVAVIICAVLLLSCLAALDHFRGLRKENANTELPGQLSLSATGPQNIIMVIADGMGPAYVSAYRYFADNPSTLHVEDTVFDNTLVGTLRTYPHTRSGLVTDSAASATAMATGYKTYNGAIGVDINKQPLETLIHRARTLGKHVGLAVTSHIVHATPASYMVANASRRNYNEIADSYYDNLIEDKHLADIMLGAGTHYFVRDTRNLVAEFEADGYQSINDYSQLADIDSSRPVLGLFANTRLPRALDDKEPHRLAVMTKAAVPFLEKRSQAMGNKGYFLLLEASQIDWAGHANDIASAMAEMDDLAKTMEYLVSYVESHPNTLVVLTADHSTGGLTLGANRDYRWEPRYLRSLDQSIPSLAKKIISIEDKAQFTARELGFEISNTDAAKINAIQQNAKPAEVEALLKSVIDVKTNTGWTTKGHTGIDVNVFAFGAGAGMFAGNNDNTDIAHKMFKLLEEGSK